MQQKDAITVLLTGRAEGAFSELVKRIITSKKLDFDLVGLKPEVGPNNQHFASTMQFKQAFLQDLVFTYKGAEEIRIYEDRVKQWAASLPHSNSLLTSPQCERLPRILRETQQIVAFSSH